MALKSSFQPCKLRYPLIPTVTNVIFHPTGCIPRAIPSPLYPPCYIFLEDLAPSRLLAIPSLPLTLLEDSAPPPRSEAA